MSDGPVTMADLDALDRCVAGASGAGSLEDLAHCFSDVVGCGCVSCVEDRAGQSGAADGGPRGAADARPSSAGSVATPPASDSDEDEDELYAAYLRATGRDPADDPTFAGREPAPPSLEVRRHAVREWGRQLGYVIDEEAREFSEAEEVALLRRWQEFRR